MKLKEIYNQLFEYKIFDYRKMGGDSIDHIVYKFDGNGIKYEFTIWHDSTKMDFGVYEVEFSTSTQKHAGSEVGKNLEHLNSVLYTVAEILDVEVEKHKIQNIKIDGAFGERDSGGEIFEPTVRTKIYIRFFGNRYGKNNIKTIGRFIFIDMTKVFPDLFTGDENYKSDALIDALVDISDADPDREGILRGFGGESPDVFSISTDFIDSKKYGTIYVEINVWADSNEYMIEYDMMDKGEEGNESFDNYDDLLNFVKTKFR